MADVTTAGGTQVVAGSGALSGIIERWVDQLDGTWARKLAVLPVVGAIFASSRSTQTAANLAPAAQTATYTTVDISVGAFTELLVGFELSAIAGTGPSAQLVMDVKLPDGTYILGVKSLTALTAAGNQLLTVAAANLPADASPLFYSMFSFGATIRFRVVIAGTTPSATFVITVQGK